MIGSLAIILGFSLFSINVNAQRFTDKIDRGLIAQKASSGVYLSWRVLGEEYYDVTYNVYRDGVKVNSLPITTSNYKDAGGSTSSTYTVSAIVRGVEQEQSKVASVWSSSYKEIKLTHEGIKSTLVPNDACCADVDGDGEVEMLMKFDNYSESSQSYPRLGPVVDGVSTQEYSIFEVLKLDGTRLWWVNCGPNMGDFQNNEQNIVGYDWDMDGKAEVVMRLLEGSTIHFANGKTYTIGADGKNGTSWTNYRAATGGGTNWFMHDGKEFLVYCNGETGEIYQCIAFPLARLESGETDLNKAWGDGYGHRSNKFFYGAPYLDGRKPSIFLARGIYTRHKMVALDVDPATHKLTQRWKWYNNTAGPWKGQGYHNYIVADVDLDGRDEIVYGSMVIDDNGKGLSTTGLGHGDAQHVSDFNPYVHGLEMMACNEDACGSNYRDATTSKIYMWDYTGKDEGRCIAGNFTNDFPGCVGVGSKTISTVTNDVVSGLSSTGINANMRIYWDGDLLSETFNYVNGHDTEGCVAKYGSWSPIYTCSGSLTNNYTKGTPCFQGDILGDWREEIIMRTPNNNIRIYSTPTYTSHRMATLWSDHQYRNAMVWQMCGYNQPPHVSYFVGELEGITMAPPPLTMTDRTEVANGGTIGSALNDKHVIVCETGNTAVTIEDGAAPYILTFNVPTWVQGSAGSESTASNSKITYTTYTCDVTGGAITGNARLVKQGDGILNLPAKDFTHTGETNIWAGTLNFDGTMKKSVLWLNRFAELNSNGGEFLSIKADYASVIRPGGENSMGNITTDTLKLGFGSRVVIDLYSDNTAADCIKTKTLNIEKKTGSAWETAGPTYLAPVIELVGHLSDGATKMAAGKYVIAECSKAINGDVNDIIVEGLATTKKSLYVEDGKLILEIFEGRDATSILWTAGVDNNWDFDATANFSLNGESTTFVAHDDVMFTDEAAKKTVTVAENVIPDTILVSNSTGSANTYTISGTGAISGDATFVKEGEGTVYMKGNNTYTGGNHLKGGTTIVTILANQYSEVGNLGAVTTSANDFTMENGAILRTSGSVEMGSPMKMIGVDGGVLNNSGDFKMDAVISGTKFTKSGNGTLYLNAANSVDTLVFQGGGVALAANASRKNIVLQAGTLWDDAQNTAHSITVPSGKSATWNLSYTYYTAYANKLYGEGSLTVVPRNTVSRVSITGDWSNFKGTIKHNTSIWLPLNNAYGLPNGTLDVASGSIVKNVAKTYKIGRLTGAGSLSYPSCDFKSSAAVSGNNTWVVGNSSDELGDFTFKGTIDDDGGSNKSVFQKIGTCKMNITGAWTLTGAVTVKEGELHFGSSASLGSGSLTVNKDAILSGSNGTGKTLNNSSTTINGTLQVGINSSSVSGYIDFNAKNVTIGSTGTLRLGLIRNVNNSPSKYSGAYVKNINTLKFNSGSTVSLFLSNNFSDLAANDTLRLWSDVTTVSGTPTVVCDTEGIIFDTSRISDGIVIVDPNSAYFTNIENIDADEIVNVDVYTLSGSKVDSFTCPKGSISSSFSLSSVANGVYLLKVKSETGKGGTLKLMK